MNRQEKAYLFGMIWLIAAGQSHTWFHTIAALISMLYFVISFVPDRWFGGNT